MNHLKALVAIADGDGSLFAADVIRHGGKHWIVPTWIEAPSKGYKSPERVVCLDPLRHQKGRFGNPPVDFFVNDPLPNSVLYGPDPPARQGEYRVVLRPKVRFPIPRGIH
jgi:hypothetical protein